MLDRFVESIPDNLRLLVSTNASMAANRPLPIVVQFQIGSLDYRVALENPGMSSGLVRRKYGAGTRNLAVHAIVAGQRLFLLDTDAFTRVENATFYAGGVVALRYRSYNMAHEPAVQGPLVFFCEALTPYAADAALVIEDELRRRLAAAASIAPPQTPEAGNGRAAAGDAAAAGGAGKRKEGGAAASVAEQAGASERGVSKALLPLERAVIAPAASATDGLVGTAEAAVRAVLVSNATTKRSLLYYNVTPRSRARAPQAWTSSRTACCAGTPAWAGASRLRASCCRRAPTPASLSWRPGRPRSFQMAAAGARERIEISRTLRTWASPAAGWLL
jgi:hypothetical protein